MRDEDQGRAEGMGKQRLLTREMVGLGGHSRGQSEAMSGTIRPK